MHATRFACLCLSDIPHGGTSGGSHSEEVLAGRNRGPARPYNPHMMDELEFRKRSDEAFASLKKSLFAAEDDADIEVEDQSGALHISFEDGARFVVSPNAPVRQIWISALTTSFKLDWSEAEKDFVLTKSGERLKPLMGRLISQQMGETVELK